MTEPQYQGLDRDASVKFYSAQMRTAWGRLHQRRFALMDGEDLCASAVEYDLTGRLDGRAVRICGIGSVFIPPAHRSVVHGRHLLEKVLLKAEQRGAEMALLFAPTDLDEEALSGFEAIPIPEVTLGVAESPRHGAPMTMVRVGEERDLAAISAIGRVRADPFRFHLDRDVDFVQYAITRKRLRAGFGSPGARQVHFFIAEEGTTAAAYVVVNVAGDTWTLEECGDRDPSGARVGALLQALIAREPVERRPTICGWLPPGFLPPQVTIISAKPARETLWARMIGASGNKPPGLAAKDVLYWHADII